MKAHAPELALIPVAIGFGASTFTDALAGEQFAGGAHVISLDITPAPEDFDALRAAAAAGGKLLLVDHHELQEPVQARLLAELPGSTLDYSNPPGNHCAVSMVHYLFVPANSIKVDLDVIEMARSMDVFAYELPARLQPYFPAFRAFLTQRGERNVTYELGAAMLVNKEACLEEGHVLAEAVAANTRTLAEGFELLAEETGRWQVWHVVQSATCRPIDFTRNQSEPNAKGGGGVPILFVTQDGQPLPTGLFNFGLRRVAETDVPCGEIAQGLKEAEGSPFVSGGGHPYAAGIQAKEAPSRDALAALVRGVMVARYGAAP
jgi:hypothetical protein